MCTPTPEEDSVGEVMRKYLTLSEVKAYLDAEAATRELGKFSSAAREHAAAFSKLSPKVASRLVEELMNANISEEYAVKLVDILPKTAEEVRAIFQKENVDEAKLSAVLEILKKAEQSEGN